MILWIIGCADTKWENKAKKEEWAKQSIYAQGALQTEVDNERLNKVWLNMTEERGKLETKDKRS